MFEKFLVTIRTVRSIGRTYGNAIAATFTQSLVHPGGPSVNSVSVQCHRLIRADTDAASTTPAQVFIHYNSISLVMARFARHNGCCLGGGGSTFFPVRNIDAWRFS